MLEILVFHFPCVETLRRNDKKNCLLFDSGGRYAIYNVSGRSYASGRLGSGRVVECGWGMTHGVSSGNVVRHAPPLHALYTLCNDMYSFLEQDPKNVCIVHCMVSV